MGPHLTPVTMMKMMVMAILKLFAVHSKTRYKHNAAKLLAELDFSECEFAFSIFLPRQALSVCLFEKSPSAAITWGGGVRGVTDTEATYWANADKYEYVTEIQICIQLYKAANYTNISRSNIYFVRHIYLNLGIGVQLL